MTNSVVARPCHRLTILSLILFVVSAVMAQDPLQPPAESETWPKLFGPTGDSVVPSQPLNLEFGKEGPRVLWSLSIGEGYSTPSVWADKVIVFHREKNEEIVDCIDRNTTKRIWRYSYPTGYVDRYGYNNGPRSTPIIADGCVFTLGAEGKLHCLRLDNGEKIWGRWINREFKVDQDFFGVGGSPCLDGDRLIINVGGTATGAGIVAFDRTTGETVWQATNDGPSYATPVVETIHGHRMVFVFTKDGLVAVNSTSGKVYWSIPFRSKKYESVNATSPLVVNDIVLVSATYGTGSLCLRVKPDGSYEELWRSERVMDSHFSNLLEVDGFVYGFSGRHEGDAELRCFELIAGEVAWSVPSILGRGSLVRAGNDFILWGERGNLVVRHLEPSDAPKLPDLRGESPSLLSWPCWTPPAIASSRLYLRDERKLVCYDLSPNDSGGKK